jgi:Na+/H+-dicarboxylate symporter
MKLVLKLLLGILIGALLGHFLPESLVRVLVTFKMLFGSFIMFVIPFIILLYITDGIAGLGHRSGRALGVTVSLTYTSTVLAGLLAILVAREAIPLVTTHFSHLKEEGTSLSPYIQLQIEPIMSVLTALLTAFIFGIGIGKVKAVSLEKVVHDGKRIMDGLLSKIIVPILPYYVATIFATMAGEGQVVDTLSTFVFVLGLVVVMHWIWLFVEYSIAALFTKQNPFALIKNMLPAYFTALGTMSSTATIPVTLRSVKNNGVSENVANFGVPLCATIHITGSVITLTTCAVAVMLIMPGLELPSFLDMLPFIFMLGIFMVAAPGVPGGGVMASLGLLSSMLGFNDTAIGLMIALYVAQDSLGTAANVTGDGAILALVNKWVPKT